MGEKLEKKIGLVMMLGDVFRVQCALPNKEMYAFPNEK